MGVAIVPTKLSVEVGHLGGVLGDRNAGGKEFVAGTLLGGSVFTWHYEQTTPTKMYNLSIIASWNKADSVLSGLYTETAIATIAAML